MPLIAYAMTYFFGLNGFKEALGISLKLYCWTFLKSSTFSELECECCLLYYEFKRNCVKLQTIVISKLLSKHEILKKTIFD